MAASHYSGEYGNWTKHRDKEDGSTWWENDDTGATSNVEPSNSDEFLRAFYGSRDESNVSGNLSNGLVTNPYNGLVDYGGDIGQSQYTRSPTLVFNQDTGKAYVQMPDGSTRAATSADSSLPVLNYSPERGNAGHGSWLDQQGTEIIGDVLRGFAGYITGGLSELFFAAAGSDGSAEEKRGSTFGAIGGLASSAVDSIASNSTGVAEGSGNEIAKSSTGLSSQAADTGQVAADPSAALNANPFDQGSTAPVTAAAPSTDLNANPFDNGTAATGTTNAATPAGTTQPKGLIDSVLDFAKNNKEVTSGAMQIGGGLLKGIGENERTQKIIQAQKDLENQRFQHQLDLQQFMRKFTQSGSFFDAALPFKGNANPITRPGGAPVYTSQGLIARGMR